MREKTYAIETENLNVYYNRFKILNSINLKVPRKTVFAIMGPSGSGKSTLLRTLNKLITLNEEAQVNGVVRIFGKNIYDPEISIIEVSRLVGMVFQTPNPFPHLSIYDNVILGPKLNRLTNGKEELSRLVKWALEKAGLWSEVKDRLKDSPSNLSIGQQQRLCIARALAMKPKILLMDEPTSNLDPKNVEKIEKLILELKKDMTIVLVTHDPAQAYRISDHIAFILSGRLIESGPTRNVLENPVKKPVKDFINKVCLIH